MRLIDADALKSYIDCGHLRSPIEVCFSELDVIRMLDKQPTIDAVPVVRCKDCEHWDIDWEPENGNKGDHFCPIMALVVPPDFFCKHGKMRCKNAAD